MPLVTPSLDDRTFDQLFELAASRIRGACPEWELAPGDPGVVLVDVFAHLTEVLLYRLNRLPDKAYVEFLRLLGVRLQPPAAAAVELVFSRRGAADRTIDIPAGTRVTVARTAGSAPAPIFMTWRDARIEAGATDTRVVAYHAERVEAEVLGTGTGQPRQSLSTRRAPVVARTADLELVIGVETTDDRVADRERSVEHDGRVYRVWSEVDTFANRHTDDTVFVADRTSGRITFAPAVGAYAGAAPPAPPALLSAAPGHARRVLAWYWHGGGAHGNVAANTLTVLRDSLPSVTVTNPGRASGGRDAESLEHALTRGPQEFRTLERAVTAGDFEDFATGAGGIARARAVAQAEVWSHATPGTVEVIMVPEVPSADLAGPLDAVQLAERHHALTRQTIQQDLDCRRPLGTRCLVNWAKYKTVRVHARLVTFREEDEAAVKRRFLERLYRTINPVAWRFGQPLRASHIYDLLLAEPGVNYVDDVTFEVDGAPSRDVRMVGHVPPRLEQRAGLQPDGLWFVASHDSVFRSANAGDGWERCARFDNEAVGIVVPNPDRAGLVAAVSDRQDGRHDSSLHLSRDAGETWSTPLPMAFHVEAVCWTTRAGTDVLFMATDVGLFEIAIDDVLEVVQVRVDTKNPKRGFSTVASVTGLRGSVSVAVAAQDNGGVFLSTEGGRPDTFRPAGLDGRDIRVLTAQYDGPRAFLWAGFAASQGAAGTGAARLELVGSEASAQGWIDFAGGWQGGSCWSIAFTGSTVFAASYQAGVLRMDLNAATPAWTAPALACGLPLRGGEHLFAWVRSVAAAGDSTTLLCASESGVHASDDHGVTFRDVSSPLYRTTVTLPPTWLFCSGEHDVTVVEGT